MLLLAGSRLSTRALAAGLLTLGLSFVAQGSEAVHVTGRVVASPGRGLASAEIVLLPVETAYREAVRRATGKELQAAARVVAARSGRFTIEVPAAGMWRLVARSEGRLPLVRHELPLTESMEVPPAELPRDEGVTVTVLGPFGSPVAGAQVRVVAGQGGLSGGGWSAWRETVTTDSAGRARVPAAAGESVVLAAWAGGFVEGRARGRSGESLELRLGYGEPVRLQVVDQQEQHGIEGVVIGTGAFQVTTTEAEGWATLVLPSRMSEVWLEGEHGGRGSDPAWGQFDAPRLLRLLGTVELRGRVVGEDGTPVGSALVWAGDDSGRAVRAAADGRFRLRVPRPNVPGRPDGWVVLRAATGSMGTVTSFDLNEAEAVGVVVTVRELWEATGSVVDAQGRPLVGARVEIRERRGALTETPPMGDVRTDGNGRFTVPRLLPGEELVARAVSPRGISEWVFLGASPAALVVGSGQPIEGRVLDIRGVAIPNATVRAFSSAGMELMMRFFDWDPRTLRVPDREIRSDREGRFVVSGFPEGNYLLEVEAPGMALEIVDGLSTTEGAELEPITLAPLAALEGVVVDPAGQPIAGARVLATAPGPGSRWAYTDDFYEFGAMTDAAGRFRIGPFRAGSPVAVTAGADGFAYACQKNIEAPAAGLRLIVPPFVELTGSVVDAGGRSRGGVPVQLGGWGSDCRTSYGQREMARETVTAADGLFRFPDLPPGGFHVSVPAQDALGAAAASVELVAGEPPPAVELRVEPKAVVVGRVLGVDGEPVPGALVGVEKPADGDSAAGARRGRVSNLTPADAEGRFRLAGLDPGATVLLAAASRTSDLARKEVVLELGEQEIDLRLEPRTFVAGWVTGATTELMAGANVVLVGEDKTFAVQAGQTGEFIFEDVPEGTYRLTAEFGDERVVLPTPVEVVLGRPVVGLRVELGAVIAGRVTGLAPAELAKVLVAAAPHQRDGAISTTHPDEDGFFFLPGLDAGEWFVAAALQETGQEAHALVTIAPGEELEPVVFALGGGLELRGEVRAPTHVGNGLSLILRSDDLRREAPVDPEGGFRLAELPPGDFELGVFAEYGGPVAVAHVKITTVGAEVFDLEFRGHRVSGRVVGQAGWPVVGGSVRIQPAEGWWGDGGHGAPLDEDGRFVLPLVPDGRWLLRLNGHSASAQLEIEVAAQDVDGVEMLATSGR